MRRKPVTLGILIGLVAALAIWIIRGDHQHNAGDQAPAAPVLAACEGSLRELVIQYLPEAAAITATAYQQFLTQLSPDVTVHVVCPDRAAFADLVERVGGTACKLQPLFTGHPMTAWARDRWLALPPLELAATGHNTTTIFCPRAEAGSDHWPQRRGDELIGGDLARALTAKVGRAHV